VVTYLDAQRNQRRETSILEIDNGTFISHYSAFPGRGWLLELICTRARNRFGEGRLGQGCVGVVVVVLTIAVPLLFGIPPFPSGFRSFGQFALFRDSFLRSMII